MQEFTVSQLSGPNPPFPSFELQGYPPHAPLPGDRGNLRDEVLLYLFTGIVLVLEPSCHPTAPRPGLTRYRVAEFWLHPGRVILFQLLLGLLMYRTSENLTLQIRDVVQRDSNQLPTWCSAIAQHAEAIRTPMRLVGQRFSAL